MTANTGFSVIIKNQPYVGTQPQKKYSVFIFFCRQESDILDIYSRKKRKEKDNDAFEKNISKTLQKLHVQEGCLA